MVLFTEDIYGKNSYRSILTIPIRKVYGEREDESLESEILSHTSHYWGLFFQQQVDDHMGWKQQ